MSCSRPPLDPNTKQQHISPFLFKILPCRNADKLRKAGVGEGKETVEEQEDSWMTSWSGVSPRKELAKIATNRARIALWRKNDQYQACQQCREKKIGGPFIPNPSRPFGRMPRAVRDAWSVVRSVRLWLKEILCIRIDGTCLETAEELWRGTLVPPQHRRFSWRGTGREWIEGRREKERLESILMPKSEEDAVGEMDMDCPEPNRPDQVQEWLAGLSPVVPAQSVVGDDEENVHPDENNMHPEGSGEMEVDEPSEIEKAEEERAVAEQADDEVSNLQIEVLLSQLQARHDAIKAKPVVKVKKTIMKKELPPDTELLDELSVGFQSGLRPDGIVEFILDDDDKPVTSDVAATQVDQNQISHVVAKGAEESQIFSGAERGTRCTGIPSTPLTRLRSRVAESMAFSHELYN
ncbi:hypothetical protein B0H14DRAFT_2563182 [Mycena olivaceomarginata]|nr:hypothetical protein B0H14DRAFT_2563182 [Mycena olivaceomarginata]